MNLSEMISIGFYQLSAPWWRGNTAAQESAF